MSSVESLTKWLQERPPDGGGTTTVQQIRLDRDTVRTLAYLARRFGMPKATLAQELLRAAIKDALDATPGNEVVPDYDDDGNPVSVRVHNMSHVHDDDESEAR